MRIFSKGDCTLYFSLRRGFKRECIRTEEYDEHIMPDDTVADTYLLLLVLTMVLLPCLLRSREGNQPQRYLFLVAYLLLGNLIYSILEGWSAVDSTYFMVVTSTTVGYGDLTPSTPTGKLFTMGWAFVGSAFIIHELTPYVSSVLVIFERMLPGNSVHPQNYVERYVRAAFGPFLLAIFGALVACCEGRTFIDALYFSMMSATTIGYGDVTPSTDVAKCFNILYLPVVTTAFANMLGRWSIISAEQSEDKSL